MKWRVACRSDCPFEGDYPSVEAVPFVCPKCDSGVSAEPIGGEV